MTCLIGGLALASLLVLSAPARAQTDGRLVHASLVGYMALNGSDLALTEFCLGRGRCREVNPVFAPLSGNPAAFGALKMASASLTSWALLRTHRTHPRLAFWLSVAGSAWYTAVVVHNVREVRKGR